MYSHTPHPFPEVSATSFRKLQGVPGEYATDSYEMTTSLPPSAHEDFKWTKRENSARPMSESVSMGQMGQMSSSAGPGGMRIRTFSIMWACSQDRILLGDSTLGFSFSLCRSLRGV